MTLFEISLKMFRKNIVRYRLYFLCCFFAATVFFCFASIFTNPSFMEGQAVNPMISGNIIFPSFLSAVFCCCLSPIRMRCYYGSLEYFVNAGKRKSLNFTVLRERYQNTV